MKDERPAERLETLAREVRRLSPDRRDPEQFHVAKAQIERELRELSRELE